MRQLSFTEVSLASETEPYDLESASYIRDTPKSSVDSNQAELRKNSDGSVAVSFGPKAPEAKEGNWIPTKEGQRFFLLFRFYGPPRRPTTAASS
jgi:hypothetical protein